MAILIMRLAGIKNQKVEVSVGEDVDGASEKTVKHSWTGDRPSYERKCGPSPDRVISEKDVVTIDGAGAGDAAVVGSRQSQVVPMLATVFALH